MKAVPMRKPAQRMMGGLIFVLSVLVFPVMADQLRGKIISVSEPDVIIQMEGTVRPQTGDEVRIGFEVPGVGFVPLEGTWSVTAIEAGGTIRARAGSGAHGVPKVQHIAIVESRASAVPAPPGTKPLPGVEEKNPETPGESTLVLTSPPRTPIEVGGPQGGAMAPPGQDPRFRERNELYTLGHQMLWVSQDPSGYATGLATLRRAAEQGHLEAIYEVGVAYSQGKGVAQDFGEAARWFEKAATGGHASGQFNIGLMHRQGLGVPQDDQLAASWFRQAAEAGISRAQAQLGMFYLEGRVVAQDDAQAAVWFRKSADGGDATGANNLGTLYREGRGVPLDYQEAMRWYQRALELGSPMASLNIGFLYERGLGVLPDRNQAIDWYRRAAAAGLPEATQRLQSLGAQ